MIVGSLFLCRDGTMRCAAFSNMGDPQHRRGETIKKGVLAAMLASILSLSACAAGGKEQTTGTSLHTVQSGSRERVYALHVPPKLPADRPVPLVLMFHGGGSTPDYAERDSGFSALADREQFLVAYPAAYQKSWNDGRAVQSIAAQREGVDDVAFVAAVIDDIARHHHIDPKSIYATGISNGGIFSHYLGARLASRIAAIAPVAGGIAELFADQFAPAAPVAVLLIHGTDDPLVPYAGGAVTVLWPWQRGRVLGVDASAGRWVTAIGANASPRLLHALDKLPDDDCRVERRVYDGGKAGTEVAVYRLVGAGHTWPDGKQYLPSALIGTVCREFNGAAEIWNFFRHHTKP